MQPPLNITNQEARILCMFFDADEACHAAAEELASLPEDLSRRTELRRTHLIQIETEMSAVRQALYEVLLVLGLYPAWIQDPGAQPSPTEAAQA